MVKPLYYIEKENFSRESLEKILKENVNVRFVSLMGVDLGGNTTDEKIPVELFLEDTDKFLKSAIQTDGSSVELHGIATLNNAKVDLMPDKNAKWYIDYNYDLIDEDNGLPVGTLKIPAFLIHDNKKVCSRGILQKADKFFKDSLMELYKKYPHILKEIGVNSYEEIDEILLTTATELEFWVNTPDDKADLEKLHISQSLKEQYWKRTHGLIRTCLEESLLLLQKMGIEPEMGHKEVGGIHSRISSEGKTNYAMEQLEVSWKFSTPLQACDNEVIVREEIGDIFERHGLEISFKAKPVKNVAGNGAHAHVGVSLKLKDGRIVNAFAPTDLEDDFLSITGYGALMGMLKHYEILNPFITSSNDGFNRLVPGFEAPVCVVTSLGHNYKTPSRNRSILVGLIRDMKNPKALRFELRSPNPLSNKYLVVAGALQTMLDGITEAAKSGLTSKDLEKELSKDCGEEKFYLEKDRKYRDENNVFDHYNEEEREKMFGKHPANVYENMKNLDIHADKLEALKKGNVFSDDIINSFRIGAIDKWKKKLSTRIIDRNSNQLRSFKKIHVNEDRDALDDLNWDKINHIKHYLMKNTASTECLFTKIKNAIKEGDYEKTSEMMMEMEDLMDEVREMYREYVKNIF